MVDRDDPARTSYDLVPYESRPFPQTSPDRLATVATLFGMSPARPSDCTVLELGCASGGNLIAMAVEYPGSRFVGLDASSRQIEEGLEVIEALGIANVDLRRADILEPVDVGPVDFVICHGVFSWVPFEVRERILAISAETLAAQGVAYISYNTYPGWHLRGMVRDMMRYHADRFDDPDTRVRQAAALLDFLAGSVRSKDGPYGKLLKAELDLIRSLSGSYLFHEHLEEVNEPMYFHRFVEQAKAHSLRYLGEAEVASMAAYRFPESVRSTLRRISHDRISAEQYLDFLRNRTFRQTLLCRGDVEFDTKIRPERLDGLHVAAAIERVEPDPADPGSSRFRGRKQEEVSTKDASLATALGYLAEIWPTPAPFGTLLEEVGADPAGPEARTLANQLLRLYVTSSLVELHVEPPGFARDVSERPAASPLARHQARSSTAVTNLRHERVTLSDGERFVIGLADGTRARDAISAAVEQAIAEGKLVPMEEGRSIVDPQAVAVATTDRALFRFARTALLRA